MTQWQRSQELLARAKQSLAGGISSNVRLLAKPYPLFFDHADGAVIVDADGNAYIDYVLGQGPMLLGHSHPAVLDAVNTAMRRGQLYAGQHELEITVAEALVDIVPCAELCRFGMSGSEMVQAAMRVARAATGRTKILRFEGHYHGWFDNVLISVAPPLDQAGERAHPNAMLMSQGQIPAVVDDFFVLPWNDLALVEQLFAERGDEIACVMTEGMMCNTGAIPPEPGFFGGRAPVVRRPRRAALHGRDHHRLPPGAHGRTGTLRCHARPGDLRQGHGRRLCQRRAGGTPGRHGAFQPGRESLGHLQQQRYRHGRQRRRADRTDA